MKCVSLFETFRRWVGWDGALGLTWAWPTCS
jgi:hypothetical protein